jgi:hypothetical protein
MSVSTEDVIYFNTVQTVTDITNSVGYIGEGAENYYNHNKKSPCSNSSEQLCAVLQTPPQFWEFNNRPPGCPESGGCSTCWLGDACGTSVTRDRGEINDQVWKGEYQSVPGGFRICCSKPDLNVCPKVNGASAVSVEWESNTDASPFWAQSGPAGITNRIVRCYYEESQFKTPKDIKNISDITNAQLKSFSNVKNTNQIYYANGVQDFLNNNNNSYNKLMGNFCGQPAQNNCRTPDFFPANSGCSGPTGCSMFNDLVYADTCRNWALETSGTTAAAAQLNSSITNYCSKYRCSPDCLCQNAGAPVADSYVDPFYSAMSQLGAGYPGIRQSYCWYRPCINESQYYLENLGTSGKDPRTESCNNVTICGQINNIIGGQGNNYNFSGVTQETNCAINPDSGGGSGTSPFYSFWQNYKWIIIGAVSIIFLILLIFIIAVSINHAEKSGERNVTPTTANPYQE